MPSFQIRIYLGNNLKVKDNEKGNQNHQLKKHNKNAT